MSVYMSDIGIRLQRVSVSCDGCRKQGTDAYDVPERIVAMRANPKETLASMGSMGGPLYQIDGGPSVEETETALSKRGWKVRQIGKTRFIFCPECRERDSAQ